MKSCRIVIFSKAPFPGFAKTRLIPALGMDGAAALAQLMLLNTLHHALDAQIGTVELCVTPEITDSAWKHCRIPAMVEVSVQGAGDLGERMARAAARINYSHEAALLIGTDCLEMSAELLRQARLDLKTRDAVIHGTADGGYALLGINRFAAPLFENIPWSTDSTAMATLGRIGRLGWQVHVGRLLHDLDEPADLKYLPDFLKDIHPQCKEFSDSATNTCPHTGPESTTCTKLFRNITEKNSIAARI